MSADDFPLVEELSPVPDVAETLRLFAEWPHVMLFDSARPDETVGRYSFLTADPFLTRIRQGGDGEEILNLVTTLPDDVPPVMYVTTRDWARKNPDKIKAFRAAIEESASFIAANPDKARDAIGKALKLPPQVLITMNLPKISTKVTPEQMAFWIDVMNKQNMLKTKIDPAKLILP